MNQFFSYVYKQLFTSASQGRATWNSFTN